jgi:hypothetical protein
MKPAEKMNRYLIFFALLLGTISLTAQTPTVANLSATGTGIKWYDAPTGGNILPSTTVLANGQHYYASQTINGCESTTRLDVVASVVNVPAPVTGVHVPSQTQIVWNWNTVSGATGYKWNTTNIYGSATDLGSVLASTETGLTCNTSYTRYLWAYNASGCVSTAATLTQTTLTCAATTSTFNYTGSMQTFTVPSGITSITIEAWGAAGGTYSNSGGLGGYSTGILSVTPGQTLYVFVGQSPANSAGGFNGGGAGFSDSYSRGGGGASDIRVGSTALGNRVIVAAGGGGATNQAIEIGGFGGGFSGGDGVGAEGYAGDHYCGHGATQSTGGAGSTYYGYSTPGSLGQGGNALMAANNLGGGGGGGYYGGGAGDHGGGGGGSSYIGGVTASSTSSGVRYGDGQVKITY